MLVCIRLLTGNAARCVPTERAPDAEDFTASEQLYASASMDSFTIPPCTVIRSIDSVQFFHDRSSKGYVEDQ